MDTSDYQKQLNYNLALIKEMDPYISRKVGELPTPVLEKLKKIKFGPKITASGIESVENIIMALTATNFYLKKAIEDPEEFIKIYGREKIKPSTQTQPANKVSSIPTPPETIISHSGESTQKPISTKTEPKIVIKIRPDISAQSTQKNSQKPATNTPPPASKIEL